jgi:hypothetical protein
MIDSWIMQWLFKSVVLYIFDLNGGCYGGELDKHVEEHWFDLFENI